MKTAEIRDKFLSFFQSKGHEVVASSSLVPGNDPTLLFTNAGMVQFKDVFLGREHRNYVRAASSQRCVRAGGKHNDLENVGYTARHHTFFEMLGNFSFGDYFKREAIEYAWEFLTVDMKIPVEKLWVTVFEEDDEAAQIWLDVIKVDPNKLRRIGAKDNFWSMGDTGPCGPCTEIFYDHGPDVAGGPPGSPDEDGDRYIEIWNLVFMQYDRSADGTLTPLPKPSVDTGMGLERIAAVMQHVHSNYEIDLFDNLIKAAAKATNTKDLQHNSLRVIADHIRSTAFLIVDGVVPSNEGRGYVLRRIIRRAARHGYELGMTKPFFHTLVDALCKEMGQAFPELLERKDVVVRALKNEEERFAETLEQGMKILNEAVDALKGKVLAGETAFKLYDTYGFPVDLTEDILNAKGLSVDMAGFEKEMEAQRTRARQSSQFASDYSDNLEYEGDTEFTGYTQVQSQAKVLSIFVDGQPVKELQTGQEGLVFLDKTPFYGESGGQVGDGGFLKNAKVEFEVLDTQKHGGGNMVHIGVVNRGTLKEWDEVSAEIDTRDRANIARHHSATHLLHAALRQVLGKHVQQKGSLVQADKLRFDFSHDSAISADEMEQIESLVNEQIRMNNPVETNLMNIEQAMASGAMALFGEKYGDEVRVLRMGEFSCELCGGTHVSRTGDIGILKVTSEGGVAAGVRRVEAVVGPLAEDWIRSNEQRIAHIASLLKTGRDQVDEKVTQLVDKVRGLEKELDKMKAKMASSMGSDLTANAIEIAGVKVLAAEMPGADAKTLRDTVDQLKNKLGSAAILLASVEDGKVRLAAGVSKDATARIKAGDLVNHVATQVGGRGGGRPDMAQAGGTEPDKLPAALASVEDWARGQLS